MPNWHTGRDFPLPNIPTHTFETEQEMDAYLRGADIEISTDSPYVRFEFAGVSLGLGIVKAETKLVKNLVPKQWLKK